MSRGAQPRHQLEYMFARGVYSHSAEKLTIDWTKRSVIFHVTALAVALGGVSVSVGSDA